MTRLYWYLRGYVQFVFTGGFAEDFINALGELGITLPGLQRQGSDLRGVCSVGTYMQLHKAARQAGGRVRITARRGLPFFLRRLRGRWGLPMGAVAFALVLCVLSGLSGMCRWWAIIEWAPAHWRLIWRRMAWPWASLGRGRRAVC